MKKRQYYLSMLLSALLLAVVAGGAQAIDLADGKFVIHGKISEQLNLRANKTSPGQLYDYSIFNFRTSFKLETMWHIQQCPDHEWNAYGVWKQFYDYADKVDEYKARYSAWDARMNQRIKVAEARGFDHDLNKNRARFDELNRIDKEPERPVRLFP